MLHRSSSVTTSASVPYIKANDIGSILMRPAFADRCDGIQLLVESANAKDLPNIFHASVCSIYGNQQMSWQLEMIERSARPKEFDALRALLSPTGKLLGLSYKLVAEGVQFDFPIPLLPMGVLRKLEDGHISEFYQKKITPRTKTSSCISLNAFEFYMFSFANSILKPHTKIMNMWGSQTQTWLYPTLLEDYLSHFVPTKTAPPVLHLSFHHNQQNTPVKAALSLQAPTNVHRSASSLTASGHNKPTAHLSLLKKPRSTSQQTIAYDQPQEDYWGTEALIQILIEFWFHESTYEPTDSQGVPVAVNSQGESFYKLVEPNLPSQDLVRVSRHLIKKLLVFCNSENECLIHLSGYYPVAMSPLSSFKSTLIPDLVAPVLFDYLSRCFESWPSDSTFEVVQELWLSFIQPWRYREEDRSKEFTNDWCPFVDHHFHFYQHFLRLALLRLLKVDLSSPRLAYLFFRLAKVIAMTKGLQPVLCEIDKELLQKEMEEEKEGNAMGRRPYGLRQPPQASLSQSLLSASLVTTAQQDIRMIFGNYMQGMASKVLESASVAVSTLSPTPDPPTDQSSGSSHSSIFNWLGLGSLWSFGSSLSDHRSPEADKVIKNLNDASVALGNFFEIEVPAARHPSSGSGDQSEQCLPDHVITENGGVELTDEGRWQMLNGLRAFEVEYQGDPALQPIRSYENPTLVRYLHRISTWINVKYGSTFELLYNRPDLTGAFSRVFLTRFDPDRRTAAEVSSPHQPGMHVKSERKERSVVSFKLRSLANYQSLLSWGACLAFIVAVLGPGSTAGIFVVVLCTLLFVVTVREYRRV